MQMAWKQQGIFSRNTLMLFPTLEIINKPVMADSEKGLNRTGFIHIAFSLGSKEAIDPLTQRLKEDGYAVVRGPRATGNDYYKSCIVGIEGNQIEITVQT